MLQLLRALNSVRLRQPKMLRTRQRMSMASRANPTGYIWDVFGMAVQISPKTVPKSLILLVTPTGLEPVFSP